MCVLLDANAEAIQADQLMRVSHLMHVRMFKFTAQQSHHRLRLKEHSYAHVLYYIVQCTIYIEMSLLPNLFLQMVGLDGSFRFLVLSINYTCVIIIRVVSLHC